jgi:hypothetical protein
MVLEDPSHEILSHSNKSKTLVMRADIKTIFNTKASTLASKSCLISGEGKHIYIILQSMYAEKPKT